MSEIKPDGSTRKTPGPEADHLKIDLPWEEAVKKALRKKPAEGGAKDTPKENERESDGGK